MATDLLTVAKYCILQRCLKEVKTKRNYLERRYETVIDYITGLWLLRKDTLELMKTFQPPVAVEFQPVTYDLYVDAFEKALRILLKDELIKEQREHHLPNKNSYRRKFAITEKGMQYHQSIAMEVIGHEPKNGSDPHTNFK